MPYSPGCRTFSRNTFRASFVVQFVVQLYASRRWNTTTSPHQLCPGMITRTLHRLFIVVSFPACGKGITKYYSQILLKSLNKAAPAPQGASRSLMRPESRESEKSLFRASFSFHYAFAPDTRSLPERFRGCKQRRFRFSILLTPPQRRPGRDRRRPGAHRRPKRSPGQDKNAENRPTPQEDSEKGLPCDEGGRARVVSKP